VASPARTSPLRGSRGRTVAMLPVRLFGFGGREASPRPRRSIITPRLAAWACRMFPWHHRADTCAACLAPSIRTVPPTAGSGLVSLLRLQSLPHPLHRFRGRSRSFRLRKSVETALQTPAAPKIMAAGAARDRLTLTALASPRTPAGSSSRSAPDSALRASRGVNGSQVRRSRYLAPGARQAKSSKTGQLLVASLIFHYASFVPERFTPKTGWTCRPVEIGPVAHQNCSTACRLRVSLFPKPERHSAPLFRWAAGKSGTALPRQCRGNEVTRRSC